MAATFEVIYDGGAVGSGEMDVRELAPALLAYASVLGEANRQLNPGSVSDPGLSIVGSPRQGSFMFTLSLQEPSILQQAVHMLSGDGVDAFLNARELVVVTGVALAAIGRGALRGRRSQAADDGSVTINIDNVTVNLDRRTVQLIDSPKFVRSAQDAVKPVDNEVAETLHVGIESEELFRLDATAAKEFWMTTDEEAPTSQEYETVLRPVMATFVAGRSWQFNDGNATSYYSILDESFLATVVEGRVTLSANDRLRCLVRFTQSSAVGKLRAERAIVRVIHHEHGHSEPLLPLD